MLPFPRSWLIAGSVLSEDAASAADRLVITLPVFDIALNLPEDVRQRIFLRLAPAPGESLVMPLRLAVEAGFGGILLEGPCRGADIQKVDVLLSAAEALAGKPVGGTSIAALAGEHPQSIPTPGDLTGKSHRLIGVGGPGHALRAALKLAGLDAEPIRQARGLTVLSAAAAGIAALAAPESGLAETMFETACRKDRADGFAGKLVTTAAEAAIANHIFSAQGAGGR